MVKPDAKHDYYADLELPQTADAEDIKKQFRQLAKQYHPDRNPGREVEVVAKFQAVQAAHEILCDPQTKTKYDTDRAKLNRVNTNVNHADLDPYNFRKPAANQAPPAHFPPPPRRTQTTKDFGSAGNPRFATSNGMPNRPASGAEKFKAFTAARPQQWDRAKFDEAARADAARGFQSMKGARGFTGQQMPPPPPPPPPPPTRPPRAPTAPKPSPFDSSPEDDQQPLRPGFPGMSRTANLRRSGFDPSSPGPGLDEQQAPNRASAYATYNRGERPQASNPHGYFPETVPPQSPPMVNKKPVVSPLRHVRSETGWEHPLSQRPNVERASSKYANTPGERTNPGGNLGRSSSVRTSPVERHWDEAEGKSRFDRPYSHHGQRLRHSSSPKPRPPGVSVDYSSSSSESSDEERSNIASRRKAQPRRPRVQTFSSERHGNRPFSNDDPALTGHFPSNNYTKIVDDNDPSTYNYPPPGNGPVRRAFSNMTSPEDIRSGVNGHNLHPDDGTPKYDPLRSSPETSSTCKSVRARQKVQSSSSRHHLPSWQVPSSVMPGYGFPFQGTRMDSIPEHRIPTLNRWLSDSPVVSKFELYREPWKADNVLPNSQRRPPPEHMESAHGASSHHSVSEENVNSKFSAADWDGKFGSGEEFLRPNIDTSDRDRRSPTKNSRSRARSTGKIKLDSRNHVRPNTPPVPGNNGYNHADNAEAQSGSDGDFQFVDAQEQPKSAAFQPGTFSADEWAERFKQQKWSTPNNDLGPRRPKLQKKSSRSAPLQETATNAAENSPFQQPLGAAGDAMDIDEDSENIPPKSDAEVEPPIRPPPATPHEQRNDGLNVNLTDLKQTAPFAPSATGLKDLDDLSSTLPFQSRAATTVDPALNRTISSTARRLDLPKPPRTVIPPPEDSLTQETWETYVHNINVYLHDWNVFNIKMLDHFRTRQDQINVGMRNNWISSIGDGPSVEKFDAADESDGLRAGFATYVAWLDDDARCRSWWDTANERHRECFENVARIRDKVKKAAGVV